MLNINIDIYQAYIGDEQLKDLSELVIPYDVSHNMDNSTREYEIFKEIYVKNKNKPNPWGMLSSKFEHKSNIDLRTFCIFASTKFNNGYELVFINPMIGNEAIFKNVWEQGTIAHTNMIIIINFIEENIPGFTKTLDGNQYFSFCNYFVVSPSVWEKYFIFVDRILKLINNEESENTDVWLSWVSSENYKRDMNITMRPFVIERLFSIFLRTLKTEKFCHYEYIKSDYIFKFGNKIGTLLYNMSHLKNVASANKDQNLIKIWNNQRNKIYKSDIMSTVYHLDDPSNYLKSNDINHLEDFINELK